MSTTHVRIDPDDPRSLPEGRIDHAVLDGTTARGPRTLPLTQNPWQTPAFARYSRA